MFVSCAEPGANIYLVQPPSQALSPLPPLVREPGNEVVKFAVLNCTYM